MLLCAKRFACSHATLLQLLCPLVSPQACLGGQERPDVHLWAQSCANALY